jgi:hypothetical protein
VGAVEEIDPLRFRFLDDDESSDSVWSFMCLSEDDLEAFTGSFRRTAGGRCDTFEVGASSSPEEGMSNTSISVSRDCFFGALTNRFLLGKVECILAGFWVFGADTAGVARGTTFAFAMGRGAIYLSPPSCPRTSPGCGVFARRPDVPVGTSADLASGFGAFGACAIACDGFAVEEAADRAGSALRDEADVLPDALPFFRATPFAGTTPSAGTRRFKRGFLRARAGYALNSSSEGTSNMSGLVIAARGGPLRLPFCVPSSSFFDVMYGIVVCLRGRSGEGGSLVDVGAGVGRDDLP